MGTISLGDSVVGITVRSKFFGMIVSLAKIPTKGNEKLTHQAWLGRRAAPVFQIVAMNSNTSRKEER